MRIPFINRTPLAWKNLTHEHRRLLLAVGGIGFAVLLIFMQLGFRGALLESTVELPQRFNADIVLVSKTKFTILIRQQFARQSLYQARSCPGVKAAYALYVETAMSSWYYPKHTEHSLPIRTLAFNPEEPVLLIDDVQKHARELMLPDTVMFDRKAKSDYGEPKAGDIAYLADHRVRVIGDFSLGTDFATDATAIISDRNYANFFFPSGAADYGLSQVDIGLVKLEDGADVQAVKRMIDDLLPDNILVRTKAEYVAAEQDFWSNSTPVGYVFGFGMVLGFVVGVIICYQILYADVTDHMSEYATLKAMGYGGSFFMGLIMKESLLVSVLGFIPALFLSKAMYLGLSAITGLPLNLTLARAAFVLALTVMMCAFSGLLTVRKLIAADPAELFR